MTDRLHILATTPNAGPILWPRLVFVLFYSGGRCFVARALPSWTWRPIRHQRSRTEPLLEHSYRCICGWNARRVRICAVVSKAGPPIDSRIYQQTHSYVARPKNGQRHRPNICMLLGRRRCGCRSQTGYFSAIRHPADCSVRCQVARSHRAEAIQLVPIRPFDIAYRTFA